MANRPRVSSRLSRRWLWAGAAACIAASLDLAGRAGHWMVQRGWRLATGSRIDSHSDDLLWVAILQKAVHVVLFGSFGLILGRAREVRLPVRLAGGVGFAVLAEALQAFSSTRTPAWSDAFLNVVCFLAGFLIGMRLEPETSLEARK
jgi:hypothetical protein